MADGLGSKISVLPEAEALDDSDLIYVVSGGASKKMTVGNAKTEFGGGGGGGCNSYSNELIYDAYTTSNGTYSLSKSIDNYDALLICGYGYASDDPTSMIVSQYVTKAEYDKYVALIATVSGGTRRMTLNFPDSTHITISAAEGSIALKYIYGLKFGGMLAPMIYSTEEREIGCWIDNKPLYTKTAHGSGSSDFTIPFDFSNIKVTKIDCIWKGSNGVYRSEPWTTSGTWCRLYAGTTYNGLCVEVNTSVEVWATVYYTKDSDVPGSGSYGSLGVPMVHYDDTEKVVGTYFGKTLYEKSYTNFSSLTGQSRTLDFGLSGIDKIWYVSEGCVISDGLYPFPYIHWDPSNVVGGFWDLNDGSPKFEFRTGSQSTSAVINTFTIRYTKTTD